MSSLQKIDRQIQEVQTKIVDLEKKRSDAMEELRQLQVQKEQLTNTASLSTDDMFKSNTTG